MSTNLTVPELKELCKEKGIKGYSKLNKPELIKLCLKISKAPVKRTSKASNKRTIKAPVKRTSKASKKRTSKKELDFENLLIDPVDYANNITITELVKLLKKLSDLYYNTDEPLVDDDVFDDLRDVLIERDPKNKYLKEVGAVISKDKVKLPFNMFSLDKIKPDTGKLEKWINKYPGPYNISDKLDGVSALIHKKGDEIKMYTRGDGTQGQDISHLVNYVVSDNVDFDKLPDDSAIRGELVISKEDFEDLGDEYKNGRNTVAGLVNSKHFSMKLAKVTKFIAYSVINPRFTKNDQMKKLLKWKIPTAVNKIVKQNVLSTEYLSKYLSDRRENGEYDIDGIVVMDSSEVYELTDSNPDFGFAYKTVLEDQVRKTTVLKVIWTPSKHGLLKPKVAIKPVKIGGSTINFATAFHAKFVEENLLGPGSEIELVRSGDVIPHILNVLKSSTSKEPSMPNTKYIWDKTNTNIIAQDINEDEDVKNIITTKKIVNFFKKLNIKYISEGIVAKLVENGYDTVIKILEADPDDLSNIDGIGEKLVSKIFNGITEAFSTVTLDQLFSGSMLFGSGIGEKKSKLVIKAFPDIMKIKWNNSTCVDNLKTIDGFDTLSATQFCNNLNEFKEFYKQLKKVDSIYFSHLEKEKPVVRKNGRFKNQKIVFTGFRDKELEKLIESEGGSVSGSVSKNTTLVVYLSKNASKYTKAVELGVKTIHKDDFN